MQRVKTTTVCEGCGREESVETEGDTFPMASPPPTWAHVSHGPRHGFVCSPECGAKVLVAWMAPPETRASLPTLPETTR